MLQAIFCYSLQSSKHKICFNLENCRVNILIMICRKIKNFVKIKFWFDLIKFIGCTVSVLLCLACITMSIWYGQVMVCMSSTGQLAHCFVIVICTDKTSHCESNINPYYYPKTLIQVGYDHYSESLPVSSQVVYMWLCSVSRRNGCWVKLIWLARFWFKGGQSGFWIMWQQKEKCDQS